MAFISFQQWEVHDATGRRKYMTGVERRAFLKAAERLPPAQRALCYVLAHSGCRVSEALDLTRDRVDADRGTLTLRTLKRRRLTFRTVPLPNEVLTMLLALPAAPGCRFWSMHRSTAWRIVSRISADSGVIGPMACGRGLRHSFAIAAATHAVPAPLLQKWMGHASIATTCIYVDAIGHEERAFAERMWNGSAQ